MRHDFLNVIAGEFSQRYERLRSPNQDLRLFGVRLGIGLPHPLRQISELHYSVTSLNGGSNHVLQLAHVARPIVVTKCCHDRLRETDPLSGAAREIIDERKNVLWSVFEGGNLKDTRVEPVEEIHAKASSLDLFLDIPVSGRDHANIDLSHVVRANLANLTLL